MPYVIEWVRPSHFSVPFFDLPIQNFGLCIGLAFILAGAVLEIECRRLRLNVDSAEILLIAMVSGVFGSKMHCFISEVISGGRITPFFQGSGLSFQGGFLFATACIIFNVKYLNKQPILKLMDAMAPGLVTGYAVGKVGCFLSGDGCYGIETAQPWGMEFPNGLVPTKGTPVHPVPLYEALFNSALFVYLMIRARDPLGIPVLNNLGFMFIGLGFLRYSLEYVRGHPIIFLGMTEYQLIALSMVIFGVIVICFSATEMGHRCMGPMHIPGKSHEAPLESTEEMEMIPQTKSYGSGEAVGGSNKKKKKSSPNKKKSQ